MLAYVVRDMIGRRLLETPSRNLALAGPWDLNAAGWWGQRWMVRTQRFSFEEAHDKLRLRHLSPLVLLYQA